MDKNQSLMLASIIFGIIGALHLIRSILGWDVTISNFDVPLYFSYIIVIVFGYLSWHLYNAGKK